MRLRARFSPRDSRVDSLRLVAVLAVASRSEPSLPIGRLRAHRTLVELRMRDLAMTTAEAGTREGRLLRVESEEPGDGEGAS